MPVISSNLKFRKKRLDILANDINKKKEGALSLLTTYDNLKTLQIFPLCTCYSMPDHLYRQGSQLHLA